MRVCIVDVLNACVVYFVLRVGHMCLCVCIDALICTPSNHCIIQSLPCIPPGLCYEMYVVCYMLSDVYILG